MKIYERRSTDEIINEWIDFKIERYKPFKLGHDKYNRKHDMDFKLQLGLMAIILFWELVKAVRNIATDQAYKMGYEMMGEQK